MPDLIQPVTTLVPFVETMSMLALEKTALEANDLVQVLAFKNVVALTPQMNLSQLQECDFGGYSRATVASWNGPFIDQAGNTYLISPEVIFICDGTSSNSVYGIATVKVNSGTQATATNPGNTGAYASGFVITNPGTKYEAAPKVMLTGATGSGATAHAVLAGDGTIASIVLDTPGSAYTTYTVVIAAPQSIVSVGNFSAPYSMALATDALPTAAEVSLPIINV